ncbi:hypothetical protein QJS04_geneDACA019039 [Acorus gramineus]|uniref:Reverse transcriptase zinc-binding domain-containing protein n=1 Tax=Acorus gramineus TaxID=55184 RepID=A0AAV9AB16_ACOGR|nr:hypothetical protein QJS04_geneDACA019039 [Acorus gramineus]
MGEVVLDTGTEDQIRWKPHSSGCFSVKEAYKWWCRDRAGSSPIQRMLPQIWNPKVPLKIKIFSWLLYHNRVVTMVYRSKWNPTASTTCILCLEEPETTQHLFCQCRIARRLWDAIGDATGLSVGFQSLEDLWAAGKDLHRPGMGKVAAHISQSIVPAGTWAIWLSRNATLFRGSRIYWENMWELFCGFVRDWGRFIAGAREVHFDNGRLRIEA